MAIFSLSESPESSALSRSIAFKSKVYGIALESTITRMDADYDVLFMLRLIMALITD